MQTGEVGIEITPIIADESDETNIHELAALIGETLDALRQAARQPA